MGAGVEDCITPWVTRVSLESGAGCRKKCAGVWKTEITVGGVGGAVGGWVKDDWLNLWGVELGCETGGVGVVEGLVEAEAGDSALEPTLAPAVKNVFDD